jgi:hypothetical protein
VERHFVVEGLAHSHEDDVPGAPSLCGEDLVPDNHLVQDLCRRKAARHAHSSGCAKGAVGRATDLCRDAEGRAAACDAEDHGLQEEALSRPEDELRRPVEGRVQPFEKAELVERERVGDLTSDRPGNSLEGLVARPLPLEEGIPQKPQPLRVHPGGAKELLDAHGVMNACR